MSLIKFGRGAAAFAGTTKRRLERLAAAAALGLVAVNAADPAVATTTFTGQFGTGNTWNVYEAVGVGFGFKDALAFATGRADPTGGATVGHLVVLETLAENDFVHLNAPGDRWIGLTDRVGVATGAEESAFLPDPLLDGWKWINGAPFGSYENWGRDPVTELPTEPNNAGSGEDAAHIRGDGMWNDNASGFGADQPVPDPNLESTFEPDTRLGFVIEWPKNLALQPAGFPGSRPDPPAPPIPPFYPTPLARLPGPTGTAAAFGVREVRDLGNAGNIVPAIDRILSGDGSITDGTAAIIDLGDPDDGAGAGPNPGSIPGFLPYIGDLDGVDDNGVQTVIKGTFQIPAGQGGNYTFNVRSDDGFGLRVLSQATPASPIVQHKFTSARSGVADGQGSLVFAAPTGDSNTQGVINLQPGTYDIEFVAYEDGGGAFWEVSTAKGDFVNGTGVAQWIALGDGATSRPGAGPFTQAARLTEQVSVKNFGQTANLADVVGQFRAGPTFTGQSTVDDVVLNGDNNLGIHGNVFGPSFVHQFPNTAGGAGIDNFSTGVTGEFTVLDLGAPGGLETLTFGLFADDHSGLHIIGEDFTAVAGGGQLTDVEGTDFWLAADFATGNSDAYGLIELAPGTYEFEAFQKEDGGGTALEVWVAAGDHTVDRFAGGSFFPLSIDTLANISLLSQTGLDLVAGPGTGPTGGATSDTDGDGDRDGADFLNLQRTNSAGIAAWKSSFGSGVSGVPEPSTVWLALAAVGLGIGSRVRKSTGSRA